jgi:hypothetical protein
MDDAATIRSLAIAAHEEARRLLELATRTPAEDGAMIGAAHKSLKLWEEVGTFIEAQRGNWLVARAYIAAGLVEPALEFGRRTMDLTSQYRDELQDFDRAFAKELAARAWALAGNIPRAAAHHADAKKLGEAIADDGDRKEFFRQFDAGPWFGLEESQASG